MPSIIAGAAIGSAVIGAGSSMMAGGQAAGASKDAARQQAMMYQITRSDLDPFRTAGVNALAPLNALAMSGPTGGGQDYVKEAYANLPGRMTQAELEATPGYQWTRDQGLKAVQGAAAARGLGISGASIKGAGQYVTGLADNTYKTQFDIGQKRFEDFLALNTGQQGNLTNQFNRVNALATLGANAAAQVGTQGTSLANESGKNIAKAGLLEGTGTMNATNALTGSLNNYLGYKAYTDRTAALTPTTTGYTDPINS
jgi:hypothetical protein